MDEDTNQFENIEDNVNLFEIQEVDQSVIMSIKELTTAYSRDKKDSKNKKRGGGALVKPLTHFNNLSIRTGQFPASWKKALVKLIFKSG